MLGILLKWGGAGLLAGTVVAGGAAGVDRMVASNHELAQPKAAYAPPIVTAANPSPDLPQPKAPAPPEPASVIEAAPAPNATPARSVTAQVTPGQLATTRPAPNGERAVAPAPKSERAAEPVPGDASEARRNAELIVSRYPKSPGVGRAEQTLRGGQPRAKE